VSDNGLSPLFYTKSEIILPRQARDKHSKRESAPKREPLFFSGGPTGSHPSDGGMPLDMPFTAWVLQYQYYNQVSAIIYSFIYLIIMI